MMKALAVGMLLMVTGVATALPVSIPTTETKNLYEEIRELALDRSGGDLGQLGVMIELNPDGTRTEKAITGDEFLAFSQFALDHLSYGVDASSADGGVGAGVDNARLAARTGWPFCDYASAFVLYFGAPGTTIVRADPSPTGNVAAGPLCGGFYGATNTWQDITIDGSSTANLFGPCIAAMVVAPLAETEVGTGGYICSSPVVSSHGNSVLVILNFFGISLDYAMGGTAVVTAGSAQA